MLQQLLRLSLNAITWGLHELAAAIRAEVVVLVLRVVGTGLGRWAGRLHRLRPKRVMMIVLGRLGLTALIAWSSNDNIAGCFALSDFFSSAASRTHYLFTYFIDKFISIKK